MLAGVLRASPAAVAADEDSAAAAAAAGHVHGLVRWRWTSFCGAAGTCSPDVPSDGWRAVALPRR